MKNICTITHNNSKAIPDFSPGLPVTEVKLALHFADWIPLSDNPVVTLRGMLGFALQRHFHGRIIDPPAGSPFWEIFKPGNNRPHPLLIDAQGGSGHARILTFTIRFFGNGRQWLEHCIAALELQEPYGFGPTQCPFRLELRDVVELPDYTELPCLSDTPYILRLRTPAQIQWRGNFVKEHGPFLHALCWAAARRGYALANTYGGNYPLDKESINNVVDSLNPLRISLRQMQGQSRVSTQTGFSIPLDGIVGYLIFAPTPDAWLLFQGAARTGIGKQVFAGQGRIRFTPLSQY